MAKWIGKVYSTLWAEFKENTFFFNDVKEKLGKYALNYLSELKKAQALFIFERRSKKRVYRLLSPDIFTYSIAHNANLGWLTQGVYANLILKVFMLLKDKFNQNLQSLGVYGSIARNTAKKDSDLDLFIIFQELPQNIDDRLLELVELKKSRIIQDELIFLNKNNIFPRINFNPLKKSELEVSFFTIDISFDMKIIFDDLKILENFLLIIHKKIEEYGIIRKYIDKGRYYLDLNINFGEVFEF